MALFRIEKIEINQIGPFGEFVLDFPKKPDNATRKAEVQILTGENGTGKTTILEALVLALGNGHSNFKIKDGKIRKAQTGSESTKVLFKGEEELEEILISSNPQSIKSSSQTLEKYYWSPFMKQEFGFAFFAYSGYRQIDDAAIKGIDELTVHPFALASDFQKSINPSLLLQWVANTIAAEAIAKNQGNHEEAALYRESVGRIEQAISEIINKKISFNLATKPFNVQIEVDGQLLDFNVLPDGLKSILSWLADLLMRMDRVSWINDTPVLERNFILFLDEIEVHMHPAWQRKILPAVQGLFPNAQIFISTHSPFVIGSVDGAWIHKLVKPNGDSHREGQAVLSEDANSYKYWLSEIFDIKSDFGPQVQADLDKFYQLRNDLLAKPDDQKRAEFTHLAKKISEQGRETESIISWELRQVNKRLSENINL